MNGCCWGDFCELPWAVRFPRNSPAFQLHYDKGLLENTATLSLPVHPTQIYSSIEGLIIFCIILLVEKYYKKKFDGMNFWLFVLLLSLSRFIIDNFRYYDSGMMFMEGDLPLKITQNQMVSIFLFIIGIVMMIVLWKRGQKHFE